jgi:hypothetical protein
VAIKVIRNVQKYRDAAIIEIDVLRALAKHDKTGSRSVLSYDMTYLVLPPYLAPLTVGDRGCQCALNSYEEGPDFAQDVFCSV